MKQKLRELIEKNRSKTLDIEKEMEAISVHCGRRGYEKSRSESLRKHYES